MSTSELHKTRILIVYDNARNEAINYLEKNQIHTLFRQAYTANIAIFAVGLVIVTAFIYADQKSYLGWFFSILVVSLGSRVLITFYANKSDEKHLSEFARYYVISSLILGLNFSFLNLVYYDLANYELHMFLTILSCGLVTAAVGSLSVWMSAYLAFSLPQIVALIVAFSLNYSYSVSITLVIFSVFILIIAKNFNLKFKEGHLLIDENIKLISRLENEISTRKKAQSELEANQYELEDKIKERTIALENTNESLNHQIGIRRQVEKQLEFLAYYDELTELPNRHLFIEDVKKSLEQAKRNESLLGVLFIDLDRFKNINNSYGHHIGDKLLKSIAVRLGETLYDTDIVARNGGDKFSVLIENMLDVREPFVVANKIIEALNEKFTIDEHNVHIGANVGIAMYPLDGNEALELVDMADTAMFEARKIGRNHFQFYSSSMSNQIADRLMLENALRDALSNNEFFLVYQPQVNILTHETSGFEALIRWNSPVFGIISPGKFIPILEETGLIYSVGEWVILEVLEFIKSGKSRDTKVSINLSPLQCGVSNYSDKIKGFINDAGINPALVEFEITETLLISDFSQTEMFLTDISNLGCTIALDDFGTGYTSFAYLTKLPIDVIKIDRSLITDIHINKNLQDIVRAIVTMSKSLGIHNVFEGVETNDELAMVKQLDGTVIQGYLFSKPLESSQLHTWFTDKTYKTAEINTQTKEA